MLFPLQINQNRLGYPGRSPGFDGSHPASVNARFSAIAGSSNFITILSLRKATLTSQAPTFGIDGALGPCGIFASGGNATSACNFAGQFAGTDLSGTVAAIIRLSSLGAINAIFSSNQTNSTNGYYLSVSTTGQIQMNLPGFVTANSGASYVTAGVPYFIAGSSITGHSNFVSLNLNTGQIKTTATTGTYTAAAGNGTMQIGCNRENSQVAVGNIAAAMYSGTLLTIQQLIQWAQDPWAFWYPRVQLPMVKPAAAARVGGATLSLMGV
jgi:hypothetical protein